ncbi:MAG: hypothetical protein PVG39_00830 [Desulfobacteraceae bacterium]|jgi:hypothetical protein
MSTSAVSICNLALAEIGEKPIRDLGESNERSRMCNYLYESCRNRQLSAFDWGFARRTATLQKLDQDHARGTPYQIPSDCLAPRSLHPQVKTKRTFFIEGQKIIVPDYLVVEGVDLHLVYTRKETDASFYTQDFIEVLTLDLASRLAGPIASDLKLAASKKKEMKLAQIEAYSNDASFDSEYPVHDENPHNDSFVNPENWGEGNLDYTD